MFLKKMMLICLGECGFLKSDIKSLNKEFKIIKIEQNEDYYLILKTRKNRFWRVFRIIKWKIISFI